MRDTHRTSAARAASYPGLPEERLLIGLAIIVAVVMAPAAPRIRLSLLVPDASRRARSPGPGGCGCGRGDTMKVFTAKEPGAAYGWPWPGLAATRRRGSRQRHATPAHSSRPP